MKEADAIEQVTLSSAIPPSPHRFRWHYAIAALVSIALSVWGAYAIAIPNPDSVLYLSAADQFAAGHWNTGLNIYKWPTYSLLIAGVMAVTGLSALLAAQVVNGVLVLGLTLAYVSLARLLSNGDRAVVTIATILIAFQPQLTQLRPWIIRDLGYLCFFVIAIYLAVADNIRPSLLQKLALLGALIAATLFRIEGLYLALLIAFYYLLVRLRTVTAQVSTIVVFLVAVTAILPVVYQIWVTGTVGRWLSGSGFDLNVGLFAGPIERRVDALETQVLFKGSGPGWTAYVSVVTGLVLMGVVRAMTPVYTFFGLFAFLPNRLIPRQAVLPVVWFAAGQLPMFFLFAFINAFLSWRFAAGFALIGMFATIFCITTSWRELLMARPRAFLVFPAFVVLALVGWLLDFPKTSDHRHYQQAASWIAENVPDDARIWMNEPRIAYFSGRDLRSVAGTTRILHYPDPSFARSRQFDVLVLASGQRSERMEMPIPPGKLKLVADFRAGEKDRVKIFAVCTAMTGCEPH